MHTAQRATRDSSLILREHALGARYASAAVELDGLPEGHGERLEGGLGPVVVVLALEGVDVHADAGGGGEGLHDVRDHLAGELALRESSKREKRGRTL